MKACKYLYGIWTAVFIYSLFSFASGPKGLSSYNQLLSERELQLANLADLEFYNEELEKVKNSLLHDPDTLKIYARQLGYGGEDERFVRIVGLEETPVIPTMAGNVYFAKEPKFVPDKTIKLTAFFTSLLFFAFFVVLELIETKTR
ncbi:MAG: septum formation initiator family protein [Treponema sp.]|jgi:cell division protein FtsB|nr:septum formation initiator family protein [Treponema sp.]